MRYNNYQPTGQTKQTTPYSFISKSKANKASVDEDTSTPEILFISSFPPRVCGIATYSQDLILALTTKFESSFTIKVCAVENGNTLNHQYPQEVTCRLDTSDTASFSKIAEQINNHKQTKMVVLQHEFGFFKQHENAFLSFLYEITKPIVVVFHTVLPSPDDKLKRLVQSVVNAASSIIVMTNHAAQLLATDYLVPKAKVTVIAHGTHLVPHLDKDSLKEKYNLANHKVLTTFGLLSSGKCIETTLRAMPAILKSIPDAMFLILGKTHPEVLKNDKEGYREKLHAIVNELRINDQVRFVNEYLELPKLLEYLQLTDIYLFTTNDPNQAVSGTFVYAMSCGCPIISTPIPHAKEVLTKDNGIIIDFQNSEQLAEGVTLLLNNDMLRNNISNNTLQKIVFTAWENSAVEHAKVFKKVVGEKMHVKYSIPPIKLAHLQKMTTELGLIQFCKINQPDFNSGYTVDDNARALIAMCMHYELTNNAEDLVTITLYLNYIGICLQPGGHFLNYMDINEEFTPQNFETNLDDANGRTIWALGYLISQKSILPDELVSRALFIFEKTIEHIETIHSTRAMAFIIKGLYYYNSAVKTASIELLTERLATRLANMYKHESSTNWEWFESYLTYANSVLPEAMLCAAQVTGKKEYEEIAVESFQFLLNNIFNDNGIEVISNKSRFYKGKEAPKFGEQPIDVAYTVMALSLFFNHFSQAEYLDKMIQAFNWFLGENRLNQIIYNPCTGGCYDGLEEFNVNLNQGAESTVSYLMARFTMQKYIDQNQIKTK